MVRVANLLPFQLDGGRWFMQARVVVHGLLEMFGAYFVPGQAINYKSPGQYIIDGAAPLSGLDQAIAITRLACVIVAVWGCCAIARRFFRRDADLVSQLLLAGIASRHDEAAATAALRPSSASAASR